MCSMCDNPPGYSLVICTFFCTSNYKTQWTMIVITVVMTTIFECLMPISYKNITAVNSYKYFARYILFPFVSKGARVRYNHLEFPRARNSQNQNSNVGSSESKAYNFSFYIA